jgi:hypothetical protein
MTDFRTLCAELADALNDLSPHLEAQSPVPLVTNAIKAWKKASDALAQPAPKVPTVMEIIELHSWLEDEWRANNDGEDLPTFDFARAVLAKWGTPAQQS